MRIAHRLRPGFLRFAGPSLLLSLWPILATGSMQEVLINFDSVLPLKHPRLLNAYRGAPPNEDHIVLIPKNIGIVVSPDGEPRLALSHSGYSCSDGSGAVGELTVALESGFQEGELEGLASELGADYPNSTFVVPIPIAGELEFVMNKHYGSVELSSASGTVFGGRMVFEGIVSPLGLRVFLSSLSEGVPVWGARIRYSLRGVEREVGSARFREATREFSFGTVFPGMCESRPNSFLDLTLRQRGCVQRRCWPCVKRFFRGGR